MKPSHVPPDGSEQALCAASAPSQLPNTVDTRTAELVERIQRGDPAAVTKLYQTLSTGLRFLICRQLGAQDADDRVHNTFVVVIEAIQRGELRDPEHLWGFVRTVVQRRIEELGRDEAAGRRDESLRAERVEVMRQVLGGLSPPEREVLRRFYVLNQPESEICRATGFTLAELRGLRSEARTRFRKLENRGAESAR